MTDAIKIDSLPDFDPAEHLRNAEDIAAYLSVILEEDDPSALPEALGTIARARGMTELAKKSGITREALYRALRAGSNPRFDTIAKVIEGLGMKLTITTDKQGSTEGVTP